MAIAIAAILGFLCGAFIMAMAAASKMADECMDKLIKEMKERDGT